MSGLKSRRKGMRVEYLVRDALRAEGFVADRVPASGASQGFKGDIRAIRDGKTYLLEVKARKDSFTKVYELMCLLHAKSKVLNFKGVETDEGSFRLGYSFSDVLPSAEHRSVLVSHTAPEYKLCKAVLNLRVLLGTCDTLVLKADKKPLVYVRYQL